MSRRNDSTWFTAAKVNTVSELSGSTRTHMTRSKQATGERLPAANTSMGFFPLLVGVVVAAAFYAIISTISWGPLQRYFLGHPIAIAATVLFWIAIAILAVKWWRNNQQWIYLHTISDKELVPSGSSQWDDDTESPGDDWLGEHHAGFVAKRWLAKLSGLTNDKRGSQLVRRLEELLTRQSQRGTSKHLADDLREISGRDADTAHDSLGLVRIIVWAIPMLGFLGTVIGITQTLGGLDFSNGTAAVDNLKSGLYVAFDTTAIGLVLSVLAIFIQFPIEQGEQRLLAAIDHRVGHLVSAHLPSNETDDNQVALIADLCAGIKAAVAEPLVAQAELWRSTIDEAHSHWQTVQTENADRISEAFEQTLAPALRTHATVIAESALASTKTADKQSKVWTETMAVNAASLASHHQKMIKQCQQVVSTTDQTKSILTLQQALDANLQRLDSTNRIVSDSVNAAAGDGMTDAMRTLARAVELLSDRIPDSNPIRRAA